MCLVAYNSSEASAIWRFLEFRMLCQQVIGYDEDAGKPPLHIRTFRNYLNYIVAWTNCRAGQPCPGFDAPLLTQ
jgi:hypothetical protein